MDYCQVCGGICHIIGSRFRHVFATLQGGSSNRASGNVGEFLASQAILVSPILFFLLIKGLWQWMHKKNQVAPSLFFCGCVTLTSLCFASVMSIFQKIQGNWLIFAYPTGFIILCWSVFSTT